MVEVNNMQTKIRTQTDKEYIYNEGKKKWFKHGSFDKEITYQTVKRTTIWFLFIPLFYSETILKTDI